jgi:hypothetical protein
LKSPGPSVVPPAKPSPREPTQVETAVVSNDKE